MNTLTNDPLAASRRMIQEFGRHYGYDISFLEELMDSSPGAFRAFEAAMPMARVAKASPAEAVFIVKIAAMRARDCGPCTELNLKMAREAGVSEDVIQCALRGGNGLNAEQRDLHDYARGVTRNEELDPDLLPRLQKRWGREIVAELAVNIIATGIYPTLKRAFGHAQSCFSFPALN